MAQNGAPNIFSVLRSVGKGALAAFLADCAQARNLPVLDAFIDHAESEGLCPRLGENAMFHAYLTDAAVDKDGVIEPVLTRFTHILATSLRGDERGLFKSYSPDDWDGPRLFRANRLIDVLDADPKRVQLLTCFAHDLAAAVRNGPIMSRLIDLGVDPMAVGGAPYKACFETRHQPLALEALSWRNLEAATALVSRMSPFQAAKLVELLCSADAKKHPSGRGPRMETWRLVGLFARSDFHHARKLLLALDERAGPECASEFRATLLRSYLSHCLQLSRPWTEACLEDIFGAPIEAIGSTPLGRRLANCLDDGVSLDGNPQVAIRLAVRAHCAPVLEVARPMLRRAAHLQYACDAEDAVSEKSFPIASEDGGQAIAGAADRLRAALAVMVDCGHSLNAPRPDVRGSLLHALVGNQRLADRTAKQTLLLDLGVDPDVKNDRGRTPRTCFEGGPSRDLYEQVLASYRARATVERALSEGANP